MGRIVCKEQGKIRVLDYERNHVGHTKRVDEITHLGKIKHQGETMAVA
jgi:hypothetical protein